MTGRAAVSRLTRCTSASRDCLTDATAAVRSATVTGLSVATDVRSIRASGATIVTFLTLLPVLLLLMIVVLFVMLFTTVFCCAKVRGGRG